ncbi:Methyltransferase domain-containing protein [Devosia enhydra]|uniref:Methyltransferase domain-containing protein n=1 Tax=Devosia enhydra TaxID=665118 RepID=A0A1K2HWI7_9HYPH|nr:class I SAM-dependent methyltransferase [Devosia enhydra]SFZ83145.1 Methyltransferase domain-containing protein [Devosia enhydra]
MAELIEDPLYRDPRLVRFYDTLNQWGPDDTFISGLAEQARSVLDLGCGTGRLAAALAPGRQVTGVDPARAMLEVGRQRQGGSEVEWIESDARHVRTGRLYDLVVMTGHVFQVFLAEADQLAVLHTVKAHLAPGGRFIFDTRNPAIRSWEGRNRANTLKRIDHPDLGAVETWNETHFDEETGVLTYVNGFRIVATGEDLSGSASIRYTPQDRVEAMLAEAGLVVERWMGDWTGGPIGPEQPEIIPIGTNAWD